MDPEYPLYVVNSNTANNSFTTTFTSFTQDLGDSYVADAETPQVFCSFGKTPAAALRAMARLLEKEQIDTWSASAVAFDKEGTHYLTIYL
jgi:hypothetical protein